MTREEFFMQEALAEAQKALAAGEVPVGAVIVRGDTIVGRGHNRREEKKNALSHAETEAIDQACRTLGGWRLWQCEMFVTLEPCPMCAGAAVNARLQKVIYGAADAKNGSCHSVVRLFSLPYSHQPACTGGVLEQECASLLSSFFNKLRNRPDTEKPAVLFSLDGAMRELLTGTQPPDITAKILHQLGNDYSLYWISRDSTDAVRAFWESCSLQDCFSGGTAYSGEHQEESAAIRSLVRRFHLSKAVLAGSRDADRAAAQTAGLSFIHVAAGKESSKRSQYRIYSLTELPDLCRVLFSPD